MFPPGAPVPEHEIYKDTVKYINEYFKSEFSKYCNRCNRKHRSVFDKCPSCGNTLLDFKDALHLVRGICERKVKRCGKCRGEYPLDLRYCPSCGNPLEEESLFWFDEENMLIKTYWNKKEISMPFYKIYDDMRREPIDGRFRPDVIELKLNYKERFDEELEKSFSRRGLKVPRPLTYYQMEKLVLAINNFHIGSLGFMNRDMIRMNFGVDLEELEREYPNIKFVKLRKDLFYIFICRERKMWE